MTLAGMIRINEDALICDMMETYHITDYRSLPASLAGKLASGLRENSRIKMEMSGLSCGLDILLLSIIADRLTTLVWFKTKDGQKGADRPESIYESLIGIKKNKNQGDYELMSVDEFNLWYLKATGKNLTGGN